MREPDDTTNPYPYVRFAAFKNGEWQLITMGPFQGASKKSLRQMVALLGWGGVGGGCVDITVEKYDPPQIQA